MTRVEVEFTGKLMGFLKEGESIDEARARLAFEAEFYHNSKSSEEPNGASRMHLWAKDE